MLPAGPRSTYPVPQAPQPGSRDLAKQLLASMKAAKANEVRPGMMTMGCDGLPLLNGLDGTACNGQGGDLVLYNPATRTVLTPINANGIKSRVTVLPAPCDIVLADLRASRRFVDNLGNLYDADGRWLANGQVPAMLETDYVHVIEAGRYQSHGGLLDDPPQMRYWTKAYLVKTYGLTLTSIVLSAPLGPSVLGIQPPDPNDIDTAVIITRPRDNTGAAPLDDCVFGGTWSGALPAQFRANIDGVGTPDTFSWLGPGGTTGASHVPITGGQQPLSGGVWVQFGATTGHAVSAFYQLWYGTIEANNSTVRPGVAARGRITVASPCVPVNSNILVTSEDDVAGTSHALVVRDADTLALLYRKPLAHDGTAYPFTVPQRFAFSTDDKGVFFMHCYTVPVLASPPTPYPGAEFGSDGTRAGSRTIAAINVDPYTFEPTIHDTITLEDNDYTVGSTFAMIPTPPPVVPPVPPTPPALPPTTPPTPAVASSGMLTTAGGSPTITGTIDDANVTFTTSLDAPGSGITEIVVDGIIDEAATWVGTVLTTSSAPHARVTIRYWR